MARSAIHPGEHLAEQLTELGMSAAELGRQLKVPTNRITGILNGQRAVTGDSALRDQRRILAQSAKVVRTPTCGTADRGSYSESSEACRTGETP